MNPEAWCVVLLLACVSGGPVRNPILPPADTNSTGFYEDSYDNITRVSEEHYVDNSTLIDSNSTRLYVDSYDDNITKLDHNFTRSYEDSYDNITRVSEEQYVDNSTLIDSNSTRLYVDSYDDNITKLDHNFTRSYEDSYDNITRVSEEHYVDNSTLIDSNSTRSYEDSYDNIISSFQSYPRQTQNHLSYSQGGCRLPTCALHNLANNLQTGDEIAGKKTTSSFGPG
ncbi:hypothetical protein CRUP_008570 [Coryphaenoides rupestris]|nr:hypothetical protein CRUP_008570 [Coryphaenoides rupestris]